MMYLTMALNVAFVLQFILCVCHGKSLILMQITIAYRIDDYQLDEAPKKNQTKNRMYKGYYK